MVDLGLRLMWCAGCSEFVGPLDLIPDGTCTHCGSTPYAGTAAQLFPLMALDAIPHELISTPAVGAGDARRTRLAAALWPQAERLIAELNRRAEEEAT